VIYQVNNRNENFIDVLDYYQTNTKVVDDMANSTWVATVGTKSNDAVNYLMGTKSIKLAEDDNTNGTLVIKRDDIPVMDLTKFANGNASNDSDYILAVVYVSDVTKVNTGAGLGIKVGFGSDATLAFGNSIGSAGQTNIVTGWNYLKILKSGFSAVGTGSFSSIQSAYMLWYSRDNSIGEYVSLQLIALLKSTPTL
jgi:hypothetical protein